MLVIAIDGPAGSGKSTVAKLISKKYNIPYLDTGAMYRALGYFLNTEKIDVNDEKTVIKKLDDIQMQIQFDNETQHVIVNGIDTTPFIRNYEVSKLASDVSKHKDVRIKLVSIQREFAENNSVVLDGRDIGTYVLPNAKFKFYLTASPEERAKRRCKEMKDKGIDIEYNAVLADINQRDYNDSHRAFAPLKKADDAIEIDTTGYSINEVLDLIEKEINK
jgi:cytidylate kinase